MTQVAEGAVTALQLHKSLLFTASADCKIKFFSFGSAFELIEERQFAFPLPIKTALLTDNFVFAALTDCTVRVHFSDTLRYKFSLFGHAMPISCLQLSNNGEKLFTASPDKTLRAWGLNFGECLKIMKLDSGC